MDIPLTNESSTRACKSCYMPCVFIHPNLQAAMAVCQASYANMIGVASLGASSASYANMTGVERFFVASS